MFVNGMTKKSSKRRQHGRWLTIFFIRMHIKLKIWLSLLNNFIFIFSLSHYNVASKGKIQKGWWWHRFCWYFINNHREKTTTLQYFPPLYALILLLEEMHLHQNVLPHHFAVTLTPWLTQGSLLSPTPLFWYKTLMICRFWSIIYYTCLCCRVENYSN